MYQKAWAQQSLSTAEVTLQYCFHKLPMLSRVLQSAQPQSTPCVPHHRGNDDKWTASLIPCCCFLRGSRCSPAAVAAVWSWSNKRVTLDDFWRQNTCTRLHRYYLVVLRQNSEALCSWQGGKWTGRLKRLTEAKPLKCTKSNHKSITWKKVM